MGSLSPYIKDVCKIGQGAECCKYLLLGTGGFNCGKIVPEEKAMIDTNWAIHEHVAQGDNCEGKEDLNDEK